MKRNSWSEISIGNSCAHAHTLVRARFASKAWGLALGGMLSSGCILLGSDNDTGQNTTVGTGSATTDASDVTTAAGSTTDTPTTAVPTSNNSESLSGTTTDASATATDSTGTGTGTTDATGTGTNTTGTDTTGTGTTTDTGTDTGTGTGTTSGGGLGEGEVCQDNPDGCAPGLLCCYPCGVPDCMNKCIKPDPNTQMCPLFP